MPRERAISVQATCAFMSTTPRRTPRANTTFGHQPCVVLREAENTQNYCERNYLTSAHVRPLHVRRLLRRTEFRCIQDAMTTSLSALVGLPDSLSLGGGSILQAISVQATAAFMSTNSMKDASGKTKDCLASLPMPTTTSSWRLEYAPKLGTTEQPPRMKRPHVSACEAAIQYRPPPMSQPTPPAAKSRPESGKKRSRTPCISFDDLQDHPL